MLQEKGYEVAVIAPSETTRFSKKKIDNIDVYGIPSLPVLIYPNVRFPIPVLLESRIYHLLQRLKPDIIHIQDHFMISKAVVKVNKKSGTPIIGTNHFMPENLTALFHFKKGRKNVEKMMWSEFSRVYNQLSLVTTPTETAADLIRPKLDIEVMAVSSGIDLEKFNPFGDTGPIREKYSLSDKRVLLYVGRLDPEKRLEDVLQAVALAVKKVDFYFVVVGKGVRKKALEELAKKLHIEDKVIFTGFVSDEDLPFFYKLSRCFIIASVAELLSLATLQAMASGLPIIAANAGALVELVEDKINGFLFEPGDINAMVQHICEIIINDCLFWKMSEKSLEFVHKHDIQKALLSFEKIYENIYEGDKNIKLL
jgi:glycosyltransferase involved in cell wall biosynthesis